MTDTANQTKLLDKAVILVVEDNPVERQLVTKVLQNADFEVISVDCGEVVIDTVVKCQPDLVLLDALLPDMDGFDVCCELRSHPKGIYLPVLMLTGLDDVESINRAYEVGSTDFFTKPINHNMLIHRIRYHLRSREMMNQLRVNTQSLENAQLVAKLGYWEYDFAKQRYTISNEMFSLYELGSGYFPDDIDILRQHCHPDDLPWVEETVRDCKNYHREEKLEHRIITPDGRVHYMELHMKLMRDESGHETHLLGLGIDVTERKESEKEILRLAYFDRLTHLPNRYLLEAMVEQAVPRAHVNGQSVAVLTLDLDLFSRVNNSMGHGAGDELLRQLSTRLLDMLNCADADAILENLSLSSRTINIADSDIVARIASDTFMIVFSGVDRQSAVVAELCYQIKESFKQPFDYCGQELFVTASIGYTYSESGSSTAEVLFQQSDLALHEVKLQGRNDSRQYSGELVAKVSNHLSMQGDIRKALDNKEFQLYFQPKISLKDNKVRGFEALVRWFHPVKGMISPDQFISVAEDTGQIVELGDWVLEAACRQTKKWLDAGLANVKVAVNVSARQFKEPGFVTRIFSILEQVALPPGCLELEMTEGVLISDTAASEMVSLLQQRGISIALDDFGTGYSSLSYITRFPINSIKIDRCFVQDITEGSDKAAIVSAVTILSHSLNFTVVAEGVETQDELAVIAALNCDEVQGYYYCRPMSAADIDQWLLQRDTSPSALVNSYNI